MTGNPEVLPRMARSYWLACEAWAVSMLALAIALIGAMVTHLMSTAVMAAVLAVPPVMAFTVAGYEWWTARGHGVLLHRGHLLAIGIAVLLWLDYPTSPGDLPFNPSSARLCEYVSQRSATCLAHADTARLHSDLAWYATGALILLLALPARRSRTAAWSALAVAFAGSAFALHFLEAFARRYGM